MPPARHLAIPRTGHVRDLNGTETNLRFSEARWSAVEAVALDPGDVHVYAAWIGGRTQPENADMLLSREELERARSFVRYSDQLHFIESHVFLRRILACYAKVNPAEIRFENGPWGKPRMSGLQGPRPVEFSLSHSRGVVLVGVAVGQAIGVDVELVRRFDECEALARRFFAPGEYRELCSLPEPARSSAFFHYWTRKEAVLKALGTGMSIPLDSFEVTLSATTQRIDFRGQAACAAEWSLLHVEPREGAVGAVAAPFRVRRIQARLIAE
jgi:4'-phosphopantetheinyl transferase